MQLVLHHGHRAMIIAMVAMAMVQPAINQVIEVIAVRHERMAAPLVTALAGDRRAGIGVCLAHGNHMLVIMPCMRMVEMTIMQKIDMPLVHDPDVTAVFAMHMRVRLVNRVRHQGAPLAEMNMRFAPSWSSP